MRPSPLPVLRRLHRGLALEGWAGVIGLGGYWLAAGPLAAVLCLAAVAFTPYLVVALWRLERVGWLGAFVAWVGGAIAGGALVSGPWAGLRGALVLVAFYSYAWVLRLAVAEWLREAEEAALWAAARARRLDDPVTALQA